MAITELAYYQSQDQGTQEIIDIIKSMMPTLTITVREASYDNRARVVESDALTIARIEGMIDMIYLMSPGGRDKIGPEAEQALIQLQRLIYGNLGCIEPQLGPYQE